MALNINFNKTNDAIRILMNLMLYKKQGEMTQQRQMDVMSEEDRFMRERAAQADVRARGLKEYESGINVVEYIKKSLIDTAKSNDAYDYNIRSAQIAETSGNKVLAEQHYNKAFELATPALTAAMDALKGKVSPENFMASLNALGSGGFEKIMNEAGQSARALTSAELEKGRQGLEAERLGLEREKFGAERGAGGKTGKEYIERWNKPLIDSLNFLEPVARGDNVMSQIYQEPAGYMSKKLSEIQMRLNNGEKLTKEDERTINESRDLKSFIKKYAVERLVGQERGPGSPTDIIETRQVELDLNRAQMERAARPTMQPVVPTTTLTPTPSITIPANAPKAYNPTTGEMAYWDGTKWIIIK